MRFLCLHGMGTNAQVFQIQLVSMQAHLQEQHEYYFLEGEADCPAAKGPQRISNPNNVSIFY